jgi:hypothetical protein
MTAILNPDFYDFDTAELVCEWDNKYPPDDFRYCHERLYRNKDGYFMLIGCGGPMSPYAIRQEGRYIDGEIHRPIDKLEVLNWLTLRHMPEKFSECIPAFHD